MKHKGRRAFGSELARAVFLRVFVTFSVSVIAFIVLYFLSGVFFRQFIWQRNDALYIFLKQIERNAFAVIAACGLVSLVIIIVYYWEKTLGYIDTMAEAAESLVEQNDDIVLLPAELKAVEARINQAKQEMLRNTRLAKDAERRKNDLVMYLAHDIKTPLTSVIGYLSLLDEAPDMPFEQKAKYVRITLDKAYRLEQLIDEFFEITRYNFQNITLSKQHIDLYYMMVQMSDEFYPQLAANGKHINIALPENMSVFGDPDKLARVFNNILKNAAAYSPENSEIEITAAVSAAKTSITITNEGSIPGDKLSFIFDKFFRLDSARSTDTGGAGLGLAIAKEIIEAHGGQIFADSGGGKTAFTVRLPNESGQYDTVPQ